MTVVSSLLFIALGVAFIVFQGSNALTGAYESFGASDISAALEVAIGSAIRENGELVTLFGALALAVAGLLAIAARRRRQARRAQSDSRTSTASSA